MNLFTRLMDSFDNPIRGIIFNSAKGVADTVKYFHPCPMSSSLPGMLHFQVTDACNANCVFCGYQYLLHQNKVMSIDIYEKGVKQYAEMGGKNISPTPIVGEPLLDPRIFERIEIAKKYNLQVKIYTNGILLNNDGNIEKILNTKNIFKVCISTAGFERQMFERVMRSKQYDNFVCGVERLLRENAKRERPLDIILTLRPDKKISEALSDPDLVERIIPHIPKENIKWILAYDNWCGMLTKNDLTGRMILNKPPFLRRKPCMSLYMPMVTVDGKIRACACRFANNLDDELVVGDLNENDLKEIWLGPKIMELRQAFRDGVLPKPCKNCSAYEPAREKTEMGESNNSS